MKCPWCGEWFDMRDPYRALEHVHDAEIEISEGPGTIAQRCSLETRQDPLLRAALPVLGG